MKHVDYHDIRNISYVVDDLRGTHVIVQEKIDGSNVGIAKHDGQIVYQSRNQVLDPNEPNKMFRPFLEWAEAEQIKGTFDDMMDGVVLFGEAMHNGGKIKYKSPKPFVLFDIYCTELSTQNGTPWSIKNPQDTAWSGDFGFPTAPLMYEGPFDYLGLEGLNRLLAAPSAFGADEIEGVVVKATNRVGKWGERIIGKLTTEKYREKAHEPKPKAAIDDTIDELVDVFVTPARYEKAWMKALEAGKNPSLKPHELIGIVAQDVHKEAQDDIKDVLFKFYWKSMSGKIAQRVLALHATSKGEPT